MMAKMRLLLVGFICALACRGDEDVCERISSMPSYLDLAPDDLKTRQTILQSLTQISMLPMDSIEKGLVAHARKIETTPSMRPLDEAMKVYLLCGVLFEFPKSPVSKATQEMFVSGMFFTTDSPLPGNEVVECILPLYRKADGSFDIRYFYKGYTGPAAVPQAGLRFFRYCRTTYPLRFNRAQSADRDPPNTRLNDTRSLATK